MEEAAKPPEFNPLIQNELLRRSFTPEELADWESLDDFVDREYLRDTPVIYADSDTTPAEFLTNAMARLGIRHTSPIKPLSAGGMAEVYEFDTERETVVVKLARDAYHDGRFKERARDEVDAQVVSAHATKKTPKVYGAVIADDYAAIFMQRYRGTDMLTCLRDKLLKDKVQKLEILIDIAEQLHANHEQGIVHCDVSPANILIGAKGAALIDFGIVEDKTKDRNPLKEDFVKGKYIYLAPESIEARDYTPKTDQYSLGMVAYELILERRYFGKDRTPDDLLYMIDRKRKGDVALRVKDRKDILDSGYPGAVCNMIDRCMRRDPMNRYASCKEFADDLRQVKDDLEIADAVVLSEDDMTILDESTAPLPAGKNEGWFRRLAGKIL